jgi:hypothetical protein
LLCALAGFLLAAWAVGAQAAPGVEAVAGYTLSLGGITFANGTVTLTDGDGRYDLALKAEVTGLGTLVSSGIARAESRGVSGGGGLTPQAFDLLTRSGGEDFAINVTYAHGDVSTFVITPPIVNNINRVPIERSQLSGVGDMLSGFIVKSKALDASLCTHRLRVFTGIERFDLTMSDIGPDKATSLRTAYQGPVEQCRIKYTPISGHFTTSEMTNYLAKSDNIFIWYAPLGDSGYYIPYRVLVATSMGDLSMVLTSLKH